MTNTLLDIWTVYERPADMPDSYVARRFEVSRQGAVATDEVVVADTLEEIRDRLAAKGLCPVSRAEMDPPQVVETWL